MKDKHRELFKEEARELLADLEKCLLELEERPEESELIGRIFRSLHTIKGSGAMLGFDEIAAFTHELETILDLVRAGKMPATKPLIDLTLSAGDLIRKMIEDSDSGVQSASTEQHRIIHGLKGLIATGGIVPENHSPGCHKAADCHQAAEISKTYKITFRPYPDAFKKGTNPLLLLNELRELGGCRIVAQTDAIPELQDFDPEECRTYWDIFLTTAKGIDAIRDVFIFVEDDCELTIESIAQGMDDKRIGEILVERGHVVEDDLKRVLGEQRCLGGAPVEGCHATAAQGQQKRIGEMLLDAGLVGPSKLVSALAEQQQLCDLRAKQRAEEMNSNIRVPADRLDKLVDLVGELVTVQARLTQTALFRDDSELISIAEEVERLTSELRDNTMSIRMVQIGTTFGKFKRLVRDLSQELGKDVSLVTEGAETELDKTVIERLNDPLVHLIRNSIDHGIEPAGVREAAGKPGQGTVRLSAVHSGAKVLIRIADDGAGLAPEAILAKAVERGLIAPDARLSEKEIFSLVLLPGFSTAEKITSVSGRGVGMDVVKRSMDALRGTIDIASEKGVGTTVTLKLPLTLAIIDGLLVNVGEGQFVLPLLSVEECVELTRADVAKANGRHLTCVRGAIVPYVRLREEFEIEGACPEIEQIVVTEVADSRIGFVVDKVVGEHQTVIKNLGKVYQDVDGVSGATILGDGTVALILDLPSLARGAEASEQG